MCEDEGSCRTNDSLALRISTDKVSFPFFFSFPPRKSSFRPQLTYSKNFQHYIVHTHVYPGITMSSVDRSKWPSLAKVIDKDIEVCS